MDTPNLKFFRVVVADNRNYTAIRIGDDDFAIQDLDPTEAFLLQFWFDRNITDSNVVLTKSHLGWWLGFRDSNKEVYLLQETLDERLQELTTIEASFFERLDYIKQPKF
jgi:hypothetical protein